jgi:hypothetical protein
MSSPIDLITKMLLTQITDLQVRVSKQDAEISKLRADIDSISSGRRSHVQSTPGSGYVASNNNYNSGNGRTVRTHNVSSTIPLTSFTPNSVTNNHGTNSPVKSGRSRPQVGSGSGTKYDKSEQGPPISLSALLKDDEKVTCNIGISRDPSGVFIYTTCVASFTGGLLKVIECQKVSGLIGKTFEKPGELLYEFMRELKNEGHINTMFKIAPWKLCSVYRDGRALTLEDLKNTN